MQVGDEVQLRHVLCSGMPNIPELWESVGGHSDVAKVISITDYHIPTHGYTGIQKGAVSQKCVVMFPNGAQLNINNPGMIEQVDNGDPLS